MHMRLCAFSLPALIIACAYDTASLTMAESDRVREPLNVCGVEVDFPFTPYPCQLVYMEKVIESLQKVRYCTLT